MPEEVCHTCQSALPAGQSFYEDHGVKVCLNCFRHRPRCANCKFPGRELVVTPPHGALCEFCRQVIKPEEALVCSLCKNPIPPGQSHYADHGETVCLPCFKLVPHRCFTCRFPQIQKPQPEVGGVCRHCLPGVIDKDSDINALIRPLYPFLQGLGHHPPAEVKPVFLPPLVVLGMQEVKEPPAPIEFLDEFVQFGLPVFQVKGIFYLLPMMNREWLLSGLLGQLVAYDLCRIHGLAALVGETPFQRFGRSWSLFAGLLLARKLKFPQVEKRLVRLGDQLHDFNRLLAMADHKPTREVIQFAQGSLGMLAKKAKPGQI